MGEDEKIELNTKLTSLLFIAIMLCSLFAGAVTAENKTGSASLNAPPNTGNTGYEPWYYYAAGGIVNTANGNLYLGEEKDISITARGFEIEIIRSYNSHNSGKHGPFGFGWTHNYNLYLIKNKDSTVTFFDEDGSAHTFSPAGGSEYNAPPGIHSKLTKNPDDSFSLWFTDGSKYNFASNGRINNIADKNGNHLNFEYNLLGRLTRVSDDSGMFLNINYDLHGRISSVADPLGREIKYEYAASDLVEVTDALGNSSFYEYYNNHKLKDKKNRLYPVETKDIKEDRVESETMFRYGEDGKFLGKDIVLTYTYEYIAQAQAATVRSDRGGGIVKKATIIKNFPIYELKYSPNNVTNVIDVSGNKTKIEHNSNGNPIKITDALGGVATMQWDSDMNLESFTDANGATTSYEYDAYGNLIKETDALGNSRRDDWNNIDTELKYISLLVRTTNARGFATNLEYDTDFNLIKIRDATGNYSVMSYDSFGDMTSIRNFRGFTTFFGYDTHGYLINIRDATGNVTEFSYDAVGRLIGTTDANGGRTKYEYDANDNLVKETDALGNETKYEYNAEGTLINTIDANGHSTSTAPNVIGKIGGVTDASGNTTSFKYDQKGNLIEYTDAKGNKTRMNYDALDRLISVVDALGNRESYVYDAVGNRIHIIDKTNNLTSYNYDALNRLTKTTDPLGHATSYFYDAVSNLRSVQNVNGRTTKYEYDALNRLSKISDPSGSETRFSYDANGNLLSHTDAKGQVVRYEYDALDMLTKIISPLGYQTKYAYDAVGNLISRVDANGNISTYSYDPLNRLLTTSYPNGGKVVRDYDAVGNILKISNIGLGLNDVTKFSYDELDRLASVKRDYGAFSKTIKYGYDANGNRVRMKDPDAGITRYEYDALNRQVKLTNPSGEVTKYQYDRLGRTVGTQYQNGISTHCSYDAAGRMLELVTVNKKSSYAYTYDSYAYTYDNMGNRLTKTEANGGITRYEYDALDQLTKVTYPLGEGFTQYTYDVVGNRLSEKDANGTTYYTYDADDRLLTAGGTSYNYDNNGNLIRKVNASGTTRYEYDYENRLTKVTLPDASQVTYQYSPLGDRLSKTDKDGTTNYLYDFKNIFYEPEDILMELDATGTQKARYTHSPGVDKPVSISRGGATFYYLFDGLGSVTSLTDVNGDIVASYKYDAFGKILAETGEAVENPYKFTGREQDEETGLYFYRARYYDATVGRFLSKDSLISEMRVTGNLYNYVDNNPVNLIDPSGHGWLSDFWQTYKYFFKKMYVKPVVKAAKVGKQKVVQAAKVVKQKVVQAAKAVKQAAETAWKATVDFAQTYWHYAKYWWPRVGIATGISMLTAVTAWFGGPYLLAGLSWLGSTGLPWLWSTGVSFYFTTLLPFIYRAYPFLIDLIDAIWGTVPTPNRATFLWTLFCLGKDLLFGENEGEDTESVEGFEREEDGETPPGPGNDHPDDNYDVSILSYSPRGAGDGGGSYESESEIAVLSRGFYHEFSDILNEVGESCGFVDVDVSIEELNKHPVFVIPSGGFYGLSSLKSFKSKLEQYVRNGSTLIVLAQQRGYEFDAVPGDLSGYGWLEDQSCHHRSVGISTYHPILSGQDSEISDVNVDGYFTKYSEDATVLLSRTKNGMPAMLMYEYGNGTVIATTIYTDWAYGHHQATADGKHLIRDMVVWAKNPEELPEYGSGDSVDIPINVASYIDLTADKVKFTVIDPDKNVVDTVNVATTVSPYETRAVNFTDTARSKLGIWHLDYSLANDSVGEVQRVRDTQRFAVSKYAANPDGWVYKGKGISYGVNSKSENYAYGSNGTFTIQLWNHGDTDKTVTCWWSFPHNYWAKHDPIYGSPGTTRPGHRSNLHRTLTVPAHGEASFVYSVPVFSYDRLWADFYEGDETSRTYLGGASRAFYCFRPTLEIKVETGKSEYASGEKVPLLLNFKNRQSVRHNTTVTVKVLDPNNKKVFEETLTVNLSAGATENRTLYYTLPAAAEKGIYIVTAEAYEEGGEGGKKIGSDSTYFEVSKSYLVDLSFDNPDKIYRVREDLRLFLKVKNLGAGVWNSTVRTAVPDLAFADARFVEVRPNETEEICYDLNVGNAAAGKHEVFVEIAVDNTTQKDAFFVPESNLELCLGGGRTSYNAGENVCVKISNTGGVDTTFVNCSIKFSDKKGFVIYENDQQGNVSAGETETVSFEIPDQAVNGTYNLLVSCKDNRTGKVSKLSKTCEVAGLKAVLSSVSDKKAYFSDENVTLTTTIANLDGAVVNGTLNLKIYSKSSRQQQREVEGTKAPRPASSSSNASKNQNQVKEQNVSRLESERGSPPGTAAPGTAGFGTTGTYIKLGIDSFAHICDYDLYYGLQYPIGNEHLAVGWWGEGFYFGYFVGGTLHDGYSYEDSGVEGLEFVSEEKTEAESEGEYVVVLRDTGGNLELTHDFLLPKSEKYVVLKVSLKNVGSERISGLKYRRVCDWDVDRSPENDFWDYLEETDGKPIMLAWDEHYAALAQSSSTPADRWDADAWGGDFYSYDTFIDDADPNGWAFDGCVFFEWEETDLDPGESTTVILYYLLGDSKEEILSLYDAAEAEEGFSKLVWEKDIPVDLLAGDVKEVVTELSVQDDLNDAVGKLDLHATLYNHINSSQVMNSSERYSFFVTDKNTSLTLETDKAVYKPKESVKIFGEVRNNAVLTDDYNLSIKKDGVEIFSDAFTLDPSESYVFTTDTTSKTSFTLEGTVDGVTVTDFVSVEAASINVSIITPDVVGLEDFNVGVLIENIGKIYADLNVRLNSSTTSTWNITVPEGESRLLETTRNITKNTTLKVTISGDVNKTIQKEIIFGENSKINLTPDPIYLEGEVEIPFTINNTGVLDSEFNATFSVSSTKRQTITKHFFVPKGGEINGSVSFNLTKGAHLLRYCSPFEEVNVTVNVQSPAEFVVAAVLPAEAERNFTLGENVTLVFCVKNEGGSEGEAELKLSVADFEETNRTWVRAGAEENVSFNFTIPDDLEEKRYKGIYELLDGGGERGEFVYLVQGANISVNASLDKKLYEEGEVAVLRLDVKNNRNMDLSLYSRVKFGEYENTTGFNLTGFASKTLTFNVPANFTGDNKMFYSVYTDSGRALYLNSIYVYEKKAGVPLRLYTEKDVYKMGENVKIEIVDVTRTDELNLTAPGYTFNDTVNGPRTLEFTLPAELRSGTYYVDYAFGNYSSAHPFDVVGFSARILEVSLDKEEYISGEDLELKLKIESNRNVSGGSGGRLRTEIYNAEDELLDEFEQNESLRAGETEIEVCRTLLTGTSGVHAVVYGFYADLNGSGLTALVSGAEYFDAEAGSGEPPVADANGPYTGVVGVPVVFDGTGSYDADGRIESYKWDFDDDGEFDDAVGAKPSKTWDAAYSGVVSLKVMDNDGLTGTDSTNLRIDAPGPPPTKPRIEVTKTVFNETSVEWASESTVRVNETVRFRIWLHNRYENETCNLSNILVKDILSESLTYEAGDATVRYPNGTVAAVEPTVVGKECRWSFPPLELKYCENLSIEFNATVVEEGEDRNTANVSGEFCGESVFAEGAARVSTVPREEAVETATGSGTAYFEVADGRIEDLEAVEEAQLPEEGKPNLDFKHGFFSLNVTGLTPGQTVAVTITLPSDAPVGTQYWKYHAAEGGWVQIPVVDGSGDDGDDEIKIRLVDGGLGDSDGTANGVIVDPGGPGSPPLPVPEFNLFGLLGLVGVLSVVLAAALLRVRKD